MGSDTSQLLQHMQAPGELGVYVLGCFERRVTLYSQQVRALNLVYALTAEKLLAPDAHVAVVGGGVAGLTAAAALLRCGFRVTLLEQEPDLLSLQWGCDKRWLHPRVYEWPAPGSLDDDARLPILSWKAASAATVADGLLAQWDAVVAAHPGRIDVKTSARNVTLVPGRGTRRTLKWEPGNKYVDFAAVILAVGFGLEKALPPVPGLSYWRDERLAQDDLGAPKRYLISGTGDGGLTDFLRATIKRFQHERIVTDFDLDPASSADARAVADRLLQIEEGARHKDRDALPEYFTRAYQDLDGASTFVDERLRKRLSPRTVTLHGLGDFPITPVASILNRYLTSRVLAVHAKAGYRGGPLTSDSIIRVGDSWQVTIAGRTEAFDEIVIRHGTDPALEAGFPGHTAWRKDLTARNALDQTRTPLWPDDWLSTASPSAPPPSVPPPSAPSVPMPRSAAVSGPLPPAAPTNRINNVPYRAKRDRMVGRAGIVDEVRRQLTANRRTAIGHRASFQGIGGLGKTQLAVEYADVYGDQYANGVIWIDADRDIDAQLIGIAEDARWIDPASEHSIKLAVALQRVRTYSDCLIIFDNLVELDAITRYLPTQTANVHVLVTSRLEQPDFPPIALNVLEPDESLRLLVQEAEREPMGPDEATAAASIASKLAGLPLALEMAGAYLRHRPSVTWREYVALLESSLKKALSGKFLDSDTSHDKDLYATLRVSEDLLVDEPLLREILDVLTLSGSASMGVSLLAALVNVPELELIDPLSLAVKLRLLGEDDVAPGVESVRRYRLHRLVREVRRDELSLGDRDAWGRAISEQIAAWFHARRERRDLPAFEAEVDHLTAWQRHAADHGWPERVRLVWLHAYPPYHRGRFQEARGSVENALRLRSDQDVDELQAHLLSDMGALERELGNLRQGMEYLQRALDIRERLDPRSADTSSSLIDVALALDELAESSKALPLALRALDISREVTGQNSVATANSLKCLGRIQDSLGNYDEALRLAEQVLAISRELNLDESELASAYGMVGFAYGRVGQHDKALTYREQNLGILRHLIGEEHPSTALALNSLGMTLLDLRRPLPALEHVHRALRIRLKVLGEKHPLTALSYGNVATVYRAIRRPRLALRFNHQALSIFEETLGRRHPRTATAANNLGGTYGSLGDTDQMLRLYDIALEVWIAVYGEDHPDTATSLSNVGEAYWNLGQRAKGLAFAKRGHGSFVAKLRPSHPSVIESALSLAHKLAQSGDVRGARSVLGKLLSRLKQGEPGYAEVVEGMRQLSGFKGYR